MQLRDGGDQARTICTRLLKVAEQTIADLKLVDAETLLSEQRGCTKSMSNCHRAERSSA